jgi:hypothetical protein
MNTRFYDSSGNFTPVHCINSNTYAFCVPKCGFGRPQTDTAVLLGKNGHFLTVLENLDTSKAFRENPTNWDNQNLDRFLELYGPLNLTKYRFDKWIYEKSQKIEHSY